MKREARISNNNDEILYNEGCFVAQSYTVIRRSLERDDFVTYSADEQELGRLASQLAMNAFQSGSFFHQYNFEGEDLVGDVLFGVRATRHNMKYHPRPTGNRLEEARVNVRILILAIEELLVRVRTDRGFSGGFTPSLATTAAHLLPAVEEVEEDMEEGAEEDTEGNIPEHMDEEAMYLEEDFEDYIDPAYSIQSSSAYSAGVLPAAPQTAAPESAPQPSMQTAPPETVTQPVDTQTATHGYNLRSRPQAKLHSKPPFKAGGHIG